MLGRRLYPAYFPPPGPARLSGPLNPVENAEGVDIRRVPLIRQLEPGATQWQKISGQPRGSGAPVSGSSRGPGPLMGPVSRDAQFTAGRPWCGADEPEWRAAAVRPTRCGVDEPNGACWLGRPLKRGRRTLTKASYLSKRAGPRVGPMNPSKQPELPSGAGLLRTVEPGAAESSDGRPTRCGADEPVRAGRPLERGVEP